MIFTNPPAQHDKTSRKLVLLSGLSDPHSCALSDVQTRFLQSIEVQENEKLWLNFPYLPEFGKSERLPSLVSASLANTMQFVRAAGSGYRKIATPHWNALADSCQDLTVVALSCGLEIINACLRTGRQPARIHIVSLGPVAWRKPPVPHTIIRGSRDFFSAPFFKQVDHLLPGVGHMNYLESPLVAQIVNDLVKQIPSVKADSI